MRAAFADISVAPGFYVRAQHDPEFFFLILYHIASIFDLQINIKERVDVKQDGPSPIIEASPPPPPPPGPQIAKEVFRK